MGKLIFSRADDPTGRAGGRIKWTTRNNRSNYTARTEPKKSENKKNENQDRAPPPYSRANPLAAALLWQRIVVIVGAGNVVVVTVERGRAERAPPPDPGAGRLAPHRPRLRARRPSSHAEERAVRLPPRVPVLLGARRLRLRRVGDVVVIVVQAEAGASGARARCRVQS